MNGNILLTKIISHVLNKHKTSEEAMLIQTIKNTYLPKSCKLMSRIEVNRRYYNYIITNIKIPKLAVIINFKLPSYQFL